MIYTAPDGKEFTSLKELRAYAFGWKPKKQKVGKQLVNPEYTGILYSRYKAYKTRITKKGKEFDITYEFFLETIDKHCIYCNKPKSGGIDRLNSDVGYIVSNCAPCCHTCNTMKSQLTVNEFITHLKLIILNVEKGEISTLINRDSQ